MSYSGDYTNYTSGPSCAYSQLSTYNDGYSMQVAPQGKNISGKYIVPTWAPISYDSLTASAPNCSGYNNIESAYGANAASCQTTYRTSVCGGNLGSNQKSGGCGGY